jgi:transcription elongation factor Elf1
MTLENHFTLLACYGPKTDAEIGLRCKKCERVFAAEIREVRPKHCTINFGRSFTVECPKCHAEATMSERDAKIYILEVYRDKVKDELDKVFGTKDDSKFESKNRDAANTSMDMKCKGCKKEFHVNVAKQINAKRDNAQMTITCPGCQAADVVTLEMALARLSAVPLFDKLADIEGGIAFLKGDTKHAER